MQVIDTISNVGPPARTCDVTVRVVKEWTEGKKTRCSAWFSMAKWLSYINVDQGYVAVLNVLYASVSKTSSIVVEISTQHLLVAGQMFRHPLLRTVTHRYISASVYHLYEKSPRSAASVMRLGLEPTEMSCA